MIKKQLLTLLKEKYAIQMKNVRLLEQAFTHSSYAHQYKRRPLADNERLEFFGDAVLQYVISDYLYKNYATYPEGKLAKLRSNIVREESLATFAKECGFGSFILLGRGEQVTGGQNKPSLLCDVFEAFLGAITLDLGLEVAEKFIYQVIIPKVESGFFEQEMDFKTELQELLQKNGDVKIEYRLVNETGPDHEKIFYMGVYLNDKKIGSGKGTSKKLAEQNAAKNALNKDK